MEGAHGEEIVRDVLTDVHVSLYLSEPLIHNIPISLLSLPDLTTN